jgi:hypothetical protein
MFVTGCYGVREVTEEVAGVFFLFMMMEKVEWSKIITQTELLIVGDSPGVPLKMGKPRLKPTKTKAKCISLKRAHGARPTPRWPPQPTKAAHSKVPSSRLRLARGYTPPSSGLRPARGHTPPSSGLRLARGRSARARPSLHAGTGI